MSRGRRSRDHQPPAPAQSLRIRYSLEVSDFAREILHFAPEPQQASVLDSPSRRGILCCNRQWGKSTTASIKAVHHAWLNPGALVLLCAPTMRQSNELLRKIREFARCVEPALRRDGHNPLSLVFSNGARIVAIPAEPDFVRGFSSVSMVLIDEASRVPDELYAALTPMLARTDGQAWLLSTPAGRTGFFYRLWQNGDPEWLRVQSTVDDCSWISPGFLAREKREKTEAQFLEEYYCVFQDSQDQLLSTDDIDAVFKPGVEPLDRLTALRFNTTQYHFYVGLDLGQTRDNTAICVLEQYSVQTNRLDPSTAQWAIESKAQVRHIEQIPLRTRYEDIAAQLARLINRYPLESHTTVIVDATGAGRPVVEILRKAGIRATIIAVTITGSGTAHYTADGINVPRHDIFAALEVSFQKRAFDIGTAIGSSQILRRELTELRTGSGHHPGDLAMALALALWQARKFRPDKG